MQTQRPLLFKHKIISATTYLQSHLQERDKINLLLFIARIGMYINPVDRYTITGFIHGYELASDQEHFFTQRCKQLLIKKYKIAYGSLGWPDQIERLSKKLSMNWVQVFKKVALEIIASEQEGGLNEEMENILKTRIESLVERIRVLGDPWFNESWIEEWLSLCATESKWFRQLWSIEVFSIIKGISKEIKAGNVFSERGFYSIPTPQLLNLKDGYDKMIEKKIE